jgi:hypothetical protein
MNRRSIALITVLTAPVILFGQQNDCKEALLRAEELTRNADQILRTQPTEAFKTLEKVLTIREHCLGSNSVEALKTLHTLANISTQIDRVRSLQLWSNYVSRAEILEKQKTFTRLNRAFAFQNMAFCYLEDDELQPAKDLCLKAAAICDSSQYESTQAKAYVSGLVFKIQFV